jgi:glycoside/pentoside/hexuronide:cation symporter, GPH family
VSRLARGPLVAYSLLAFPLAMAALPVYVHVPKFYAETLGVPLAWVGFILLAARILDAVQDPFLGYLSDRAAQGSLGRRALIVIGMPLLAAGFVALFHPPAGDPLNTALWLAGSLLVVYLGFSAVSVSYLAIGAELSLDYHERTRVTATRGAFGVLGVLVAAALPEMLANRLGAEAGLARFSELFLPLLLVCTVFTLARSPRSPVRHLRTAGNWRSMFAPMANRDFRWLMAVFVASGVAGAIPGTLILFFVADVLQRPSFAGLFLGLYFLAGALGMPAWIAAARQFGKKLAWLAAMLMAIVAFVWAFSLGEGDVIAFAVVCVLSGIAYGAELALPPSMLADVVDRDAGNTGNRPDGAYFGLWQMVEKLNLALAAGVALPMLALLGYQPGIAQQSHAALSAMYALLPCVIKLGAAALLWLAPIDGASARRPTLAQRGEIG